MKSVLISIRPEWCDLIARGEKTLEVRKNRPKQETPFKCYIYRTKGTVNHIANGKWFKMQVGGTVIGEFICDDCSLLSKAHYGYIEQFAHITREALNTYMGLEAGRELSCDDGCWGWHISDLKIYDRPKQLSDFWQHGNGAEDYCTACPYHETPIDMEPCKSCDGNRKYLTRPPQSWCYVEEV